MSARETTEQLPYSRNRASESELFRILRPSEIFDLFQTWQQRTRSLVTSRQFHDILGIGNLVNRGYIAIIFYLSRSCPIYILNLILICNYLIIDIFSYEFNLCLLINRFINDTFYWFVKRSFLICWEKINRNNIYIFILTYTKLVVGICADSLCSNGLRIELSSFIDFLSFYLSDETLDAELYLLQALTDVMYYTRT